MLSQEEWYKKLRSMSDVTKEWTSENTKAQYGHYRAEVEKLRRGEQLLHIQNGLHYTLNGVVKAPKVNSNTNIPIDYNSMIPIQVVCMDTFVARKFLQLKASSESRDKQFDLSLSDVRKLLKRKTCHYTGMPLGSYPNSTHPNQITIDRVDPSLGYVKGNVVACSHLANQFKNKIEHDFQEFLPREKIIKILEKMFA